MSKRKDAKTGPKLVNEDNLSKAWSIAMLQTIDHPGLEISPLILSVTGFSEDGSPAEDMAVRRELDKLLLAKDHLNVEDVAFTIFPQEVWKIARGDRTAFFNMYREAYPRYRAMNKKANRRGLYFGRLTSYGSGPLDGNQLEWILSQYSARENTRRSMLQASIFDPARDHVPDAQLQFPCMQHVSFEPTGDGLVINAFYATQQLFIKAYGNYLGIARLGAFMAGQMDMPLARMNVIVGVAKFEGIAKGSLELKPLIEAARNCVASDRAALQPVAETET